MTPQAGQAEDTTPAARAAAAMNALSPAERCVAEAVHHDPELIIESTAQELADRYGIARTSVIRGAQSLGYRGYAQLRVAVSRHFRADQVATVSAALPDGELGAVVEQVRGVATALPEGMGLLDSAALELAIERLSQGGRVLCVGNALSGPLAADAAMRLAAMGVWAEHAPDAFAQQVSARLLGPGDTALVISGSGSNELSLKTARAARAAGAAVIAITSFGRSPLVELTDACLVVASVHETFRDELEHSSRVAHLVFLEALLVRVAARRGASGRTARDLVLEVLADNLAESGEF